MFCSLFFPLRRVYGGTIAERLGRIIHPNPLILEQDAASQPRPELEASISFFLREGIVECLRLACSHCIGGEPEVRRWGGTEVYGGLILKPREARGRGEAEASEHPELQQPLGVPLPCLHTEERTLNCGPAASRSPAPYFLSSNQVIRPSWVHSLSSSPTTPLT